VRSRAVVVGLLVTLAAACSAGTDEPPDAPSTASDSSDATTTTRVDSAAAPEPLDCEHWRYGPDDEPAPGTLPSEFDRSDYRRTSQRDLRFATSPTEHCGQMGAAVDLAWGVTQGRDDVLIAVLDSGIEWRNADAMLDLATQAFVNLGEARPDCPASDGDCNGDGRFDIDDFVASDTPIDDLNLNGLIDPEDLILSESWSDGIDDDNNGYVDDISGWDVLYDDNNPLDTVGYGHGTGEAKDSVAAANGTGDVGTCPKCRFVPVRVSDSFIAGGTQFADGVDYAVTTGAAVVQEALGAISNPSHAQTAIDAAFAADVVVVASMADEASYHANLPAALDHTLAVNSITTKEPLLGGDLEGYLALNGCTNGGAITLVSVPSNSCSSEATGIMSGLVGLVLSAARDSGTELAAGEVVQIVRASADDVDFSGQYGDSVGGLIDTVRYPTTPGWDAVHGYGRVNAYEMVKAARVGAVPPIVDITEPRWFTVTDGIVRLEAEVTAMRGGFTDVRVEWASGLQPPEGPAADRWHVVHEIDEASTEVDLLLEIDLSEALADGPPVDLRTGRPFEHHGAVRVRVVAVAGELVGIDQHQVFVHADPELIRNAVVDGAGTATPTFAQLDGDAGEELLIATDDGTLHAFDVNGDELPGFPIESESHSPFMVGAPVVVDLDDEAGSEIVVTNFDGEVLAWHANGEPVAGFPVTVDPRWSLDDPLSQDRFNRTKPHFYAQPAVGDIDGDGSPEVVAAAADRHLYAWHANGTPVAGFPVQLVDPDKVAGLDPTNHKVTFKPDSGVGDGGELIAVPAIGDVDGDGRDDIVVGAQEQYAETINVGVPEGGAGGDVLGLLATAGTLGNTRLYAVDGSGEYLEGWPTKLGMVALEVLPTIGGGVAMPAVIADVHPRRGNEVIAASAAGPLYVFGADGVSVYGQVDGRDVPVAWSGGLDGSGLDRFGTARNSDDTIATFVSFGGPSVGDLDGDGDLDIAAPGGGITRLLDVQASDLQLPNDDQLLAWDPATGDFLPGFPHATSDIAFFVTPRIVDVDDDGVNEVVAGNGLHVLAAVHADGSIPDGWPKLTGGWLVGSPAIGDLEGDGRPEIAIVRRDGVVLVWSSSG
jgi:Subtilase family